MHVVNRHVSIADQFDALVAYWDSDMVCRYINDAYEQWSGFSRGEAVNKLSLPQVLGDMYRENLPYINEALEGHPQRFDRDIKFPSGKVKRMCVHYYPDFGDDGSVKGFVAYARDITRASATGKALEAAESRMNAFLEAMPGSLMVAGQRGNIKFASDRCSRIFGYAQQSLTGKPLSDLVSPLGMAAFVAAWDQVASGAAAGKGRNIAVEIVMADALGKDFPAELMVHSYWAGEELMHNIEVRDITIRKQQEDSLLRMAAIIESSSDAIISKDLNGIIVTWNAGAEKILGYTLQEVQGRHISILFPQELIHEEAELMSKVLSGAPVAQYETVRMRKDGARIDVAITLSAIRDQFGRVTGVSKILRDISQNKKAERALKDSQEQNKIFVDQAPNALAMFNTGMYYVAASQRWIEDYKLQGQEIIGKSHYDVFPEISDEWKKIHEECLRGAVNKCDEAIFRRADGSVQWIQWEVRPWFKSHGEIGGLLMYTADITRQKEREANRSRIQNIYEKSSQVARIASWEVDTESGVTTWSPLANEIFEVSADFVPGVDNTLPFYQKGKHLDDLLAAIRASAENGVPYDQEAEIITAKGNHRWLRVVGEAEFVDGKCLRRYGILQDITKAKEAELRLQQLNDELEAVLNSGPVSIIGTDRMGLITHFSRGAEEMLGYKAEEMVGKQTPAVIHKMEEMVARGKELSALFGRPVTGINVFVEMVRLGHAETREWTYLRKDGSTLPVQLVVTAIKNRHGEFTGFLGVATDISVLKKAETETKSLLDLTMDQNERLKNFAHIVSHNLRSHSGNISMIIDLLDSEMPELGQNEYFGLLKMGAENLRETIANLTEVVQINTSTQEKFEPLVLHAHAEAAINTVSQLAVQADVVIKNTIDPSIRISGLRAYIDSVILNFITNSIKYRAADRKAEVILSAWHEDKFVVLSVKDNGLGIDLSRYRSRLFGMYKTFHHHKDARGIGLFITKNQVEAMGGKIEVESEVNKGTDFKIYFKSEED